MFGVYRLSTTRPMAPNDCSYMRAGLVLAELAIEGPILAGLSGPPPHTAFVGIHDGRE